MNLDRFVAVVVLALAATSACTTAHAQTIFLCGNEYTNVPCPNGRVLDTNDARSGAERAEARRLLAEQKRQASDMERDRRRNEAAIKPATAGQLSASPVTAPASAPKKAVPKKKRPKVLIADDGEFTARSPNTGKKKSASL